MQKTPVSLSLLVYVSDNLALLPVVSIEEPLFIIDSIGKITSLTADILLKVR